MYTFKRVHEKIYPYLHQFYGKKGGHRKTTDVLISPSDFTHHWNRHYDVEFPHRTLPNIIDKKGEGHTSCTIL